MADRKPKRDRDVEGLIEDSKTKLESIFQLFIQIIGSDLTKKIMKQWNELPDSRTYKAANDAEPWTPNAYYELVKLLLVKTTVDAKEQVFGMTKRKLSEFTLSDFKNKKINQNLKDLEDQFSELESLVSIYKLNPVSYQAELRETLSRLEDKAKRIKSQLIEEFELTPQELSRINSKVDLLIDTQIADIKKGVALQYQTSVSSTDSETQLRKDLNDKTSELSYGPMTYAGSAVMSAQAVNDGRSDAFQDIEDQIESYTFIAVDDDRTTEVCAELDGTTFSPDDPDLDKYRPPLHYNCRSYLSPNLRTFKNNPSIDDEPLELSKKAVGQINLSESCCPTNEKNEHLEQLFRALRQRPRD